MSEQTSIVDGFMHMMYDKCRCIMAPEGKTLVFDYCLTRGGEIRKKVRRHGFIDVKVTEDGLILQDVTSFKKFNPEDVIVIATLFSKIVSEFEQYKAMKARNEK